MVLGGGEDYVLLFTISKKNHSKLRLENPDLEYYLIGEVTEETGHVEVVHLGKPVRITRPGFDHFANK